MANNNPHAGHRERMFNKYVEHGIGIFKEHELLEMLLFILIPRVNTNEIAHNLINEFGSLKDVLLTHYDELQRIKGIGENTSIRLRFIGDIAKYVFREKITPLVCFSSESLVCEYCVNHFKDKKYEYLTLLLMDDFYALLHVHDMTSGKPNHIAVDYRELLAQVIKYDCRKIVLSHNHLIGSADPSRDDIKTTREIGMFLKVINVGLVDHIVVRENRCVSMRGYRELNEVWDM